MPAVYRLGEDMFPRCTHFLGLKNTVFWQFLTTTTMQTFNFYFTVFAPTRVLHIWVNRAPPTHCLKVLARNVKFCFPADI